MAQQQQQSSGGGDNSMAPAWITVLIFLIAYVIWYAGHQYIVSFIFSLNVFQAKLVSYFMGTGVLSNEIYIMQTIDPKDVDWAQLMLLTRSVGDYVRYPVIVLCIILAVILYKSNVTLKFKRAHDMSSLRKQEQYNWPSIAPVVPEDLVATDLTTGPWAMALSPLEFARKYNLLRKEDVLLDSPIPGQEMTAGVRRGDAKRVFTLQLGPYYDSFDHSPPHVRALAAVFMSRINRDRESAKKILETFDKASITGQPDYAFSSMVLRKYQQSELVHSIISKHAYLLTVMASLLFAARDDGVVSSADFLWLKTVDRRLWYMLNCVGRQTPYSEVGGPFAHWKAEKAIGRRSLVPMVDEAIKALELAVKEVKLSFKELQELQP